MAWSTAICASTSLLDHARYVFTPVLLPDISKMYFMCLLLLPSIFRTFTAWSEPTRKSRHGRTAVLFFLSDRTGTGRARNGTDSGDIDASSLDNRDYELNPLGARGVGEIG